MWNSRIEVESTWNPLRRFYFPFSLFQIPIKSIWYPLGFLLVYYNFGGTVIFQLDSTRFQVEYLESTGIQLDFVEDGKVLHSNNLLLP
jgi:hypothetical protein